MKDIRCATIANEISVYCYDTNKFKSENISIYFSVPHNQKESIKRSLLLSVLKRGTKKYPSQKLINETLDELYATLVNLKNQKFEQEHLLGISADIINSSYTEEGEELFPRVLEIIKEMLFCPLTDENGIFCEEFVKSEKENYKSVILSQINEPRTFAAIRCREEMFAPLGIIDKLDTMCQRIDDVTPSELYDCYKDIVENAKIKVFYVGKRTPDEIAECVTKAFPERKVKSDLLNNATVKLLENVDIPNTVIENSEVSQGRLVMGFNCRTTWRDDDYYSMLLCNEILGASPISKLMVNVREKMSLCYECSSVYNSARGVIFVTTGIDCENYELAKGAIIDQLDAMAKGDISDKEFDAAKKSIFNVYSALKDSPSAIERFYLGRIINGINVDVEDFVNKIAALEKSDVIRAAQKLKLHTVYFLSGEGEHDE